MMLLEELGTMFPDARCELNYRNPYELLIAVMLSAQTTDYAVNQATPRLFEKYSSIELLAKADLEEVKGLIKTIGIYNNKSHNIIEMANQVTNEFNGVIPSSFLDLIKLKGVGRKTANVYLSELGIEPRIAVDTHVFRVSHRLGLVDSQADVLEVEKTLMNKFKKEDWVFLHQHLVFLGRYICKSNKPLCYKCIIKECPMKRELENAGKNI